MRYTDKRVIIDGYEKTITLLKPMSNVELYRLCIKLWARHTHFCKIPFPFIEDRGGWVKIEDRRIRWP